MTGALERIGAELAAVVQAVDGTEVDGMAAAIRTVPGAVTTTGQGRSGAVASMAAMRLMHLGFAAHWAPEPTAPAIREGDGLLVVSGSGATAVSLHYARIAHDQGARIMLVTKNPDGPIGRIAERTIRIPVESSVQPGGSLFEQAALTVVDAVVLRLADDIPGVAARLRARHTNLQ